jgi:TolA-binding protein
MMRSTVFRWRPLAAALLVASFAQVTQAALFDDEEARKRIEATNTRVAQVQKQLEDRIAALEAQMKSQGLMDLFTQVEAIRADIARLRGQIEVLNHEQEQSQKRQRDLYIDLDSRVRKLESAPAAAAVAPPAAVVVAPPAVVVAPTRAATTPRWSNSRLAIMAPRSAASRVSSRPIRRVLSPLPPSTGSATRNSRSGISAAPLPPSDS